MKFTIPILKIFLMKKCITFYKLPFETNMKRFFLFILLITSFFTSYCQRGEKLESLKIGYLTNKLNLDARTAENFWPLYHQYENELMAVVQEKRRINQNDNRNAEEILDQEQKALDIKRKYNVLFAKVISNEQLNQLYRAEKEFRQMVINRAQKREQRQEGKMLNRADQINRNERRIEGRPPRMEERPRPNQYNREQNNMQQAPTPPGPPSDGRRGKLGR